MKRNARKIIRSVIKKGISFILIAFIFIGVFCSVIQNNDLIVKKFFGTKAEVQGIIELWSVSSFESGTASKSSHLERIALEFEKQNKGVYVLISTLTLDECKLRLENGMKPDLFSFTGDVGEEIKKDLQKLDEINGVKEVLLSSAKNEKGELLAYPWAVGGYVIISSSQRIQNAGAEETMNLIDNVMNLSYEKNLKKSTKTVYSLVYGTKNGNNPNLALSQELSIRGISLKENKNSLYPEVQNLTSYDAYSRFVSGESVVLLGSQRDLARIEAREKSGREEGFIVDYFSAFNDLVDYVGVVKSDDENKMNLAKSFSRFLLSENSQKLLSKIGLFMTLDTNELIYVDDSYFSNLEKSLKQISIVPNIFA